MNSRMPVALLVVGLGALAGGLWLFGRPTGRGATLAQSAVRPADDAAATDELVPAPAPEAARDEEVDAPTTSTDRDGVRKPDTSPTDWLRRILPERFGALSDAELLALEDVDLHGATVGDGDLWRLALLPNLKRLGLRGTQVSDAGIAALTRLPLHALDLRSTQVTGNCFALLPVAELEALHLTDTHVSEADLARLPTLPALKTLKLNFLALSDLALERLAPQPGLTHLELDQTGLSDEGLRRLLAQFPTLMRIEARGTRVSDELHAELRTTRPGLELVLE